MKRQHKDGMAILRVAAELYAKDSISSIEFKKLPRMSTEEQNKLISDHFSVKHDPFKEISDRLLKDIQALDPNDSKLERINRILSI